MSKILVSSTHFIAPDRARGPRAWTGHGRCGHDTASDNNTFPIWRQSFGLNPTMNIAQQKLPEVDTNLRPVAWRAVWQFLDLQSCQHNRFG